MPKCTTSSVTDLGNHAETEAGSKSSWRVTGQDIREVLAQRKTLAASAERSLHKPRDPRSFDSPNQVVLERLRLPFKVRSPSIAKVLDVGKFPAQGRQLGGVRTCE